MPRSTDHTRAVQSKGSAAAGTSTWVGPSTIVCTSDSGRLSCATVGTSTLPLALSRADGAAGPASAISQFGMNALGSKVSASSPSVPMAPAISTP